ncbi:hypothetical protein AAVH_22737 [Aphelenchoides avenae]|nr:hypothetical protein AAVH_22737 [Aphelenchus avenae]
MCGAVDNPQFMKSTTRPGLAACVGHVSYTKTYKKGELTNRQFVLLALEQMWEESKEQINSTFWDHLTLAHMLYGKNYGVACGITECAPAAADSVTRTFSCSYQTFHTHWHSKAKYVGPPPAGQQCVPGTTCEIGRICDAGANCRVDGCAKTIHMSSVCHEPSGLCDHSMLGYEYQAGQWGARVHCWQYAGPYNGTCVLDGNSNCICE